MALQVCNRANNNTVIFTTDFSHDLQPLPRVSQHSCSQLPHTNYPHTHGLSRRCLRECDSIFPCRSPFATGCYLELWREPANTSFLEKCPLCWCVVCASAEIAQCRARDLARVVDRTHVAVDEVILLANKLTKLRTSSRSAFH